jgi:hypothetical protein
MNCTTRSHVVGYFYKIYIMMHGSMNIKSNSILFMTAGLVIRRLVQCVSEAGSLCYLVFRPLFRIYVFFISYLCAFVITTATGRQPICS